MNKFNSCVFSILVGSSVFFVTNAQAQTVNLAEINPSDSSNINLAVEQSGNAATTLRQKDITIPQDAIASEAQINSSPVPAQPSNRNQRIPLSSRIFAAPFMQQ